MIRPLAVAVLTGCRVVPIRFTPDAGKSPTALEALWQSELAAFATRRAKYLLY